MAEDVIEERLARLLCEEQGEAWPEGGRERGDWRRRARMLLADQRAIARLAEEIEQAETAVDLRAARRAERQAMAAVTDPGDPNTQQMEG